MSYEQIKQSEDQYPIATQCEVLEVSRSGYYDWRNRPVSMRERENLQLVEKIKEAYTESEETYGSPRIHAELVEQGLQVGENKVARLMRENMVVSIHRKKFRSTTDSNHNLPVAENLLDRNFEATAPNQKWVGDITYIPTREAWLYLAVVIDLFSRQVVGWSFSDTLSRGIAIDALQMAIKQRGISAQLFHSDRGVQYASGAFQKELEDAGIICSMSRKGNCWDNSVSESFFHTLKVERVHRRSYVTRDHARADIFDYLERFYNRKRKHSTLGYLSPVAFEELRLAA